MGAPKFHAQRGAAEVIDGLAIAGLSGVAFADQRSRAGLDAQRPVGPLARVICESLWSAAAARSGAPLRVAASMSSTTAQLAGASAREPWLACSAAASACSCLAETVVQHRRGPFSPAKPGALLAALCLFHAGLDQPGGLGFPAPRGGKHQRRVRRDAAPGRLGH